MINQISHLYFQQKLSIRVQVTNGEPWFCLKDVCSVLDIKNSRDMLAKQLDKDGVDKIYVTDSLSRQQQLTFVNEPNLYRVIFRSNKPEAKQFQDWVFNEVLPTIRKTGHYEHPVCRTPRTTSEPLTPNDEHNLNHLVTLMSMSFKRQASWSKGIWYALRKASGAPSPEQFTVSDLPALAEECRRVIQVTSATSEMIVRIKAEALRRIVRNGEECERVLAQLQGEAESIDFAPGVQTLARFERLALERMECRLAS